MQRVGFLKWATTLSSPTRAQTLEALTRRFEASVTERVRIDEDHRDAWEQYVREQSRRYKANAEFAELQDIWLSDPHLPSQSGAITGDLERAGYRHSVHVEIPTWAIRLQLIREKNHTQTDRGRALKLARLDSVPSLDNSNPLALTAGERYVFLFLLADSDGDFLRGMFQRLLTLERFSRADAGRAAMEALQELRSTRMKTALTGALQEARHKADKVILAIKNQKKGMGPLESVATPRTEPLVDLGLLTKPDRRSYEYGFSETGRSVFRSLIDCGSVAEYLVSALSRSLRNDTLSSAEPVLLDVHEAYSQMKSGLGYVSVRELAIACIAQRLERRLPPFEIQQIEQLLSSTAGRGDGTVRLAAGRTGGIAQVRINFGGRPE